MASYDQLSAQQRAIVDLILKRGQSYEQLAEKLGMPETRVRELAVEALTSLAPVSAAEVDEGVRPEIADYLLGQQAVPEATATRGQLRRSEAGRAWSRSVLDSLEHLYPKGDLPSIPSADSAAEPEPRAPKAAKPPKAPRERKPAAPRAPLSPEAAAVVRRRRLIAAAAGGVLLLFVLLIWPVGLLTGGDDSDGGDKQAGARTQLVGQVVLRPTQEGSEDAGIAIVTRRGEQLELSLQARVTPTKRNQAYEVWLYNSPDDARSLGAQVTDDQGGFAGRTNLPANYKDYRFIDVSRETVDRNAAHSGTSVLRARTDAIRKPSGNAQGGGAATTP
jgi:hypothetical protein